MSSFLRGREPAAQDDCGVQEETPMDDDKKSAVSRRAEFDWRVGEHQRLRR
jgi:hypothetical protein